MRLVNVGCTLGLALALTACGRSAPTTKAAPDSNRGTPDTAPKSTEAARPQPKAPPTRAIAWFLGKQLSLAALGNGAGAPQSSVDDSLDKARTLAAASGTVVPPLPAKQATRAASLAAALAYLVTDAGKTIQADLAKNYDAEHAALFEMAVKSNLLLLLYSPGDSTGKAAAEGVRKAGSQAGLADTLTADLVSAVSQAQPQDTVRKAVFAMQQQIEDELRAGN